MRPVHPDASDEAVGEARRAARERLDTVARDIREALGLPAS